MRDSVVLGIGSVNPVCFDQLMEEFSTSGIVREVLDKKIESNVRRRKRKELLRLQFLRVLEMSLLRQLFRYGSYADGYVSGRGLSSGSRNTVIHMYNRGHVFDVPYSFSGPWDPTQCSPGLSGHRLSEYNPDAAPG